MKRIVPVLLIATVALSACGSDDAVTDAVTVVEAWSRASAPTQTQGAVYFDLTVADDDTLLGASVPSSVAAGAQIHEAVMVDDSPDETEEMDEMDEIDSSEGSHEMDEMDDMDTDIDESGRMLMQELPDGLALTGGETVSFEPGSYHVMLPELAAPLEVGDEFELTLEFANADDVTVTVEVAESAP
jgi:hypothetical protein